MSSSAFARSCIPRRVASNSRSSSPAAARSGKPSRCRCRITSSPSGRRGAGSAPPGLVTVVAWLWPAIVCMVGVGGWLGCRRAARVVISVSGRMGSQCRANGRAGLRARRMAVVREERGRRASAATRDHVHAITPNAITCPREPLLSRRGRSASQDLVSCLIIFIHCTQSWQARTQVKSISYTPSEYPGGRAPQAITTVTQKSNYKSNGTDSRAPRNRQRSQRYLLPQTAT